MLKNYKTTLLVVDTPTDEKMVLPFYSKVKATIPSICDGVPDMMTFIDEPSEDEYNKLVETILKVGEVIFYVGQNPSLAIRKLMWVAGKEELKEPGKDVKVKIHNFF